MKKLFLFALLLSVGSLAFAQTAAKPKPPVIALALKSLNDSTSYAIGVSIASFYKEQGITNINTTILSAAVKDVLAGKKLKLDEATCNATMNQAMTKAQDKKSKGNLDSGAAFLAKNKMNPGIKTTATGLQYEVITEGTGAKPAAVDSVTCHYRGTLLNGTEFDNSYARGAPITFALNRVISGWTEGLQLMSVGSKYKLYIPHTLGYGTYDNGPIPGGSTLVFEVELLDVKKAQ
ncbi:MAG: FKBP-type peptidyl-prolyl cis-trans isomerase [Chitinophagaceae bacterium]